MSKIEKYNWEIVTLVNRTIAIDKIKKSIATIEGGILNFNFFSDLGASFTIELQRDKVETFYDLLSIDFSISSKTEVFHQSSTKDTWVLLNVTFGAGEGNMRNQFPDVPG